MVKLKSFNYFSQPNFQSIIAISKYNIDKIYQLNKLLKTNLKSHTIKG